MKSLLSVHRTTGMGAIFKVSLIKESQTLAVTLVSNGRLGVARPAGICEECEVQVSALQCAWLPHQKGHSLLWGRWVWTLGCPAQRHVQAGRHECGLTMGQGAARASRAVPGE